MYLWNRELDPDLRAVGWGEWGMGWLGGEGGGGHVLSTSMHGTLRRVVTERFCIVDTHTHTQRHEVEGWLRAHAASHGRRRATVGRMQDSLT